MDEKRAFNPVELEQQDNQECLDTCLLMMMSGYTGEKLDYYAELRSLYHSAYGLYKPSYLLGRTAAFARRFSDCVLKIGVDDRDLSNYLIALNQEENIRIEEERVTVESVLKQLDKNPLTILVDQLHLGYEFVHTTHYILVFNEKGNLMMIDPAKGSKEELSYETLQHVINGLRYQMFWAPVTIRMKK